MRSDVTTLLELIRGMNDPVGWDVQDQSDACSYCGSTMVYEEAKNTPFPRFDHYRSCEFAEMKELAERLLVLADDQSQIEPRRGGLMNAPAPAKVVDQVAEGR
jgi:hypothetical protein